MALHLVGRHLDGIVVLRPDRYRDDRGYFEETYRQDVYAAAGLPTDFVQDNHSRSRNGVLRGMHFQLDPPQGKLLRVVRGAIQLVEVDVRPSSPTFGQHVVLDVSEDNGHMVWIPPGFANGFLVLTDHADVVYRCTGLYNPATERSVHPFDPALAIPWRTRAVTLSGKDASAPTLADTDLGGAPQYG